MDRATVREVLEQATGLQVSHYLRPPDTVPAGSISWIVRAGGRALAVRTRASARAAAVAHAAGRLRDAAGTLGAGVVPLLVVPRIGPVGAEICRGLGVGYLDLDGNAHLEAPGLRVHVELPRQRRPRGRPASAFAPRSSLVARVLLEDPARRWCQAELARGTGLGAGFVSRIVRRLLDEGLLRRDDRGALSPVDPALLFDAWREDYDFGRHRVIERQAPGGAASRLVRELGAALEDAGIRHAFTGLAALSRRARIESVTAVTVYVAEPPSGRCLETCGLTARPGPANVRLAIPGDEGVLRGAARRRGARCVTVLQALLDVESVPEVSAAEAAALRLRLGFEKPRAARIRRRSRRSPGPV